MPAPRILILGATGGLGRALNRHLAPDHETVLWGRAELDFERPEAIAAQLKAQPFDVLLNVAGMTSPDVCEMQPEKARMANVIGPQVLAEYCHALGARLIHFSTDYVFSGEPRDVWKEDDETNPVNVYGRTKREGELAVLQASPNALVARVSWLFGPDKPSHPDHIIQRALQTDDLAAVADKVSVPTSTVNICDWIERIIHEHPETSGVLHLCNTGSASWHSWAETALEVAAGLGLPVKTTHVKPIKLADLTQLKAPRPLMTVMCNERLQNRLGIEIRHWREALEEHLVEKHRQK
ncbi:dTDP-4-dehydrorhamnose reductase [Prosthecobacter sp.]|uniref:dTDP-4-dehydrorhamnose reductase n=1 Tax=Prosthecobacter sp. TaxID=1965333 RepID=UPI002AB96BB4|nr:dTDP-4-dehydrorhamnose reductase [Prosthecobacter sp.]MDZ4405595.1 dTDP-4-dehydrorhamnose reductase [Prosthecobacter sp.]